MKKAVSLVSAAFGAACVYVMDPVAGKRRRALARDAVIHGAKVFRRAVNITARDTADRLKGFIEVGKGLFKHGHISDEILADRVRTEIGRVSSHPHVEVIVEEGCVTLLGPVAAHEEVPVLEAIESVRGVQAIVNRMEPYAPAANMRTQARRMRILNRQKRLVGVVSIGDIAKASSEKQFAGETLGHIAEAA